MRCGFLTIAALLVPWVAKGAKNRGVRGDVHAVPDYGVTWRHRQFSVIDLATISIKLISKEPYITPCITVILEFHFLLPAVVVYSFLAVVDLIVVSCACATLASRFQAARQRAQTLQTKSSVHRRAAGGRPAGSNVVPTDALRTRASASNINVGCPETIILQRYR